MLNDFRPDHHPHLPPATGQPKQPWHKPTVTFVSLLITTFAIASAIDGQNGDQPIPP